MAKGTDLKPVTRGQTTSRIEGRRHSRIQITSGPPEILFKKFGRPDGKGGFRLGADFGECVAEIRTIAGSILRARRLPDVPRVFFTKSEPSSWRTDPASPTEFACGSTIDHYVRKQGFALDSREDLAARIIVTIARMQSNPRSAEQHAFELGRLWTLLRVYTAESAPGAKGGKRAALTKRERAAAWQQRITGAVMRHIAVGRSDSNIGALLASNAGKSARTVAAYAAKVRENFGRKKKVAE